MFKNIVLVFLFLSLSGCVTSSNVDKKSEKEKILVKTENYHELIVFYKEQLREEESKEVREKLSQAYMDNGDPDSALFTIHLLEQSNRSVSSFLIEANALLELGMLEKALTTADHAYLLDKNNASIENLIGIIYAAKKDIPKARHYFNLARKNLYSDSKIKNNLAVLDIIEGNYDKANDRLLRLYMNDKDDVLVKSNLMLSMAKSGEIEFMKRSLSPEYSEYQISNHYIALRNSELQKNNDNLTDEAESNDENQE